MTKPNPFSAVELANVFWLITCIHEHRSLCTHGGQLTRKNCIRLNDLSFIVRMLYIDTPLVHYLCVITVVICAIIAICQPIFIWIYDDMMLERFFSLSHTVHLYYFACFYVYIEQPQGTMADNYWSMSMWSDEP